MVATERWLSVRWERLPASFIAFIYGEINPLAGHSIGQGSGWRFLSNDTPSLYVALLKESFNTGQPTRSTSQFARRDSRLTAALPI